MVKPELLERLKEAFHNDQADLFVRLWRADKGCRNIKVLQVPAASMFFKAGEISYATSILSKYLSTSNDPEAIALFLLITRSSPDTFTKGAAVAESKMRLLSNESLLKHLSTWSISLRRFGLDDLLSILIQRLEKAYPNSEHVLIVKGNIRRDQGLWDESKTAFEEALKLNANSSLAKFNLGLIHFLLNDFQRAAPLWRERWQLPNFEKIKQKTTELREADALDTLSLVDKHVLVIMEQGVGTELQTLPMILSWIQNNKVNATLFFSAKNTPVLRKHANNLQVDFESIEALPSYRGDNFRWAGSMDILLNSCTGFGDIAQISKTYQPVLRRHTRTTSNIISAIKGAASGRKVIGISWYTKDQFDGAKRNIPLKSLLTNLQNKLDALVIDLQYRDPNDSFFLNPSEYDSENMFLPEGLDPWSDPTSLIDALSACDGVITCANATAHYAASLGIPTINLIPHVPSWRWGVNRFEVSWYPSMVLCRNESNDWEITIKEGVSLLWKLIDSPS